MANLPERSFIPQKQLYRLLSRDRISAVIRDIPSIPIHRAENVINIIAKGASKVFAILSLLKGEEGRIVDFISHDQFQQSSLDSRLPFSLEMLQDIIPDIAIDFYRAQWDLSAPIFSRGVVHRELHDSTRLPFVREALIGEGGFGQVYELELHADHQTPNFLPREDHFRAVRKEFRRSHDEVDEYKLEIQNLNILNELCHPNIVDLLGSYTYREKHNLIFPLAPGGDLASVFENDRPEALGSDQSFYRALSHLSSAVQTVHAFTSKSLDLRYIGCHHDLRPRNILVKGDRLILADFGLSSLKPGNESSKDEFQIGAGHYLAPECEDFANNFKKQMVGRSSDIWSFGCILAEVLTYMKRGKEAVVAFKKARAIRIGNFKTYTFHAGCRSSHPQVATWLSALEAEGTQADKLCVDLIRRMLSIDPEDRPNAEKVTSRLRSIAVIAQMRSLDALFAELDRRTDSIEADLERRRYKAWKETVELLTNGYSWQTCALDVKLGFEDIFECLVRIESETEGILSRVETALRPLFNSLRLCLDDLVSSLSAEQQEQIRTRIELDILKAEDVEALHSSQLKFTQAQGGNRIGMLITIKRMSLLALERTTPAQSVLQLAPSTVDILTTGNKPFVDHDLGVMKDNQNKPKSRVIIEWRRYATHWQGPVSEEMIARIEGNAQLLSSENKPPKLQALDCVGFFHQPLRHAFGIAYQLPGPAMQTSELTPLTLATIILKTMDTRARPSLGDRFNLANQLASSVLEFHKVGWMHKAICPHHVAFFPKKTCSPLLWIRKGYIIGFNHSRKNDPKSFTEGPSVHNPAEKYQHFQYHGDQEYVQAFDYYSLGLVLLEIGLWKLLEDQITGWKYASSLDMRHMLLERRVALLAHHMGTKYCEAVQACLSVEVTHSHSAEISGTTRGEINFSQLDFATRVLQPLRTCSA
ncbi:kinase-like domain-containing protein [Dactylonectria macrodidyma]|uniref:Kinase-like domain-containing protein n=1 Tax=Dactylonectria macrodidyma TaxID=307937 RepID=A0A9P9IWL1_9HYPO|nr:kinase-like domain-containing protein [Dactylonectria macrodidyma]